MASENTPTLTPRDKWERLTDLRKNGVRLALQSLEDGISLWDLAFFDTSTLNRVGSRQQAEGEERENCENKGKTHVGDSEGLVADGGY